MSMTEVKAKAGILGNQELNPILLLKHAYDSSTIRRRDNGAKLVPFWWTEEIELQRTECISGRRRVTRRYRRRVTRRHRSSGHLTEDADTDYKVQSSVN
nr:unnamed protein product [Callosobruchus chinensis]